MAIPSVKTIEAAFKKDLQPGDAQKIRALMEGSGRTRGVEDALDAISKILGGFGHEVINDSRNNYVGFWQQAVLAYVNMGDPYVATVWFQTGRDGFADFGKWGVGGYGDWLESYEQKHGQLEGLKSPRRGSFMRVPGAKGRSLSGLGTFTPPASMNVIDKHGGFTMENTTPKQGTYTLWRPGAALKNTQGTLVSSNPHTFFQNNNDVTRAVYKVPGYRYLVHVWFDNKTGNRLA